MLIPRLGQRLYQPTVYAFATSQAAPAPRCPPRAQRRWGVQYCAASWRQRRTQGTTQRRAMHAGGHPTRIKSTSKLWCFAEKWNMNVCQCKRTSGGGSGGHDGGARGGEANGVRGRPAVAQRRRRRWLAARSASKRCSQGKPALPGGPVAPRGRLLGPHPNQAADFRRTVPRTAQCRCADTPTGSLRHQHAPAPIPHSPQTQTMQWRLRYGA